jgi:hypothetical protein
VRRLLQKSGLLIMRPLKNFKKEGRLHRPSESPGTPRHHRSREGTVRDRSLSVFHFAYGLRRRKTSGKLNVTMGAVQRLTALDSTA